MQLTGWGWEQELWAVMDENKEDVLKRIQTSCIQTYTFNRTLMKSFPNRLVVYPKDVRNITGRCYRSSCVLLQNIRKANGKKKGDYVTLEEFCTYMELPGEFVRSFLSQLRAARNELREEGRDEVESSVVNREYGGKRKYPGLHHSAFQSLNHSTAQQKLAFERCPKIPLL